MTIRDLTAEEHAVLAHIVVDPLAWWANANAVTSLDHEAALAAKVARWKSDYEVALAQLGADYKTRAQQEQEAAS